MSRPWTTREVETARRLRREGWTLRQIAAYLHRSLGGTDRACRGVSRPRGARRRWTADDDARAEAWRPLTEIARELDRSPLAVRTRRHRLRALRKEEGDDTCPQ